jgi:hypothetical protein
VTADRTRRWSNLRRIIALVVSLSLLSGPLEALIPDMHDGHSPAIGMTATDAPSQQDGSDSPVHAVHVDHCSHGHLVALSQTQAMPRMVRPMSSRQLYADRELVSIEIAPRLRPPIA